MGIHKHNARAVFIGTDSTTYQCNGCQSIWSEDDIGPMDAYKLIPTNQLQPEQLQGFKAALANKPGVHDAS